MNALSWLLFAGCCIASALIGWTTNSIRHELAEDVEQPGGDRDA